MSSFAHGIRCLDGNDLFNGERLNWRQRVERLIYEEDVVTLSVEEINRRIPASITVFITRSYLPRPECIPKHVFNEISEDIYQKFWSGDVESIECVYKKLMAQKMVESRSNIIDSEGSLKWATIETAMVVENLIDLTSQFYTSINKDVQDQPPTSYPTSNSASVSITTLPPVDSLAAATSDVNIVPVTVSSEPQSEKDSLVNKGKIIAATQVLSAATSHSAIPILNQVSSPRQTLQQSRQPSPYRPLSLKTTFRTLPDISAIRSDKCSKLGKVRVVKSSGCTVRSDVDIDNSMELHKLKHLDEAYYDQMTLLPEIPRETVAIYRLHIYFNVWDDASNSIVVKSGWASLQGRTLDDMLPILEIVSLVEKVPEKVPEKAPLAPVSVAPSTSNIVRSSSVSPRVTCPFCSIDITLHDLPAREHHVNNCGQGVTTALPSGAAKRGKENERVAQQQAAHKKSKAVVEANKSACPICARMVLTTLFEAHVNECLNN